MSKVAIGKRYVGQQEPAYIIGEIGINHNGDIDIAKKLIDVAAAAGFDAVKFQKRTPEECVPADQRDVKRDTPWGVMTYMEYRRKVEFGVDEYSEISNYCRKKDIDWLASCWDISSIDFMKRFDPIAYKVPSALITNIKLLEHISQTGRPVILSTGMSTLAEIRQAITKLERERTILLHCTSSYPCKPEEINLMMLKSLREEFPDIPVGYSGHEVGLQISYAAMAMGACLIERHITLDRSMWGSDQAASVEPSGMFRLVRDIRIIEVARGDGVKKVYDSEKSALAKLRGTY
jgi:N-acetylneuraminate synthase